MTMLSDIIIIIIWITFGFFVSAQEPASTDGNIDKGRIVGGSIVDIRYRPYQVALYTDGGFCGGSIIGLNKVLTAAHCVRGKTAPQLTVYAGSTFRNFGGISYSVDRVVIHPNYNTTVPNDYDVAVLTMRSLFRYYSNVRPIGLLTTRPADGTATVVSGWGSTRLDGGIQTILRQVYVPIVNQTECRSQYGTASITNNMICAGFTAGGKDSCQGDSGGPLTYNGQLVGVVSFGSGCALPNFAGVYASVPELRSWIISQ